MNYERLHDAFGESRRPQKSYCGNGYGIIAVEDMGFDDRLQSASL